VATRVGLTQICPSYILRTGFKELGTYQHLNNTQLALVPFSQLSAAVVRHKANDGIVYAIRAWFKYDTASGTAYSRIHSSSAVAYLVATMNECMQHDDLHWQTTLHCSECNKANSAAMSAE